MTFSRSRQAEWMDAPDLDNGLHRQALAGLRRINTWSRSGAAIWRAIEKYVRRRGLSEIRILDLATGAGDVSLYIAGEARRNGLRAHITGCDVSPVAIGEARALAGTLGLASVEFQELNVFSSELPRGFDIVMCSLFLHHLDEPQAIDLLRHMGQATDDLVLVDDLRRTQFGYWLAWLGCHVLTRSPVVHKDGPISVIGAFTPQEAVEMAAKAGLQYATFETHWPQRYLLSWSRRENNTR